MLIDRFKQLKWPEVQIEIKGTLTVIVFSMNKCLQLLHTQPPYLNLSLYPIKYHSFCESFSQKVCVIYMRMYNAVAHFIDNNATPSGSCIHLRTQ